MQPLWRRPVVAHQRVERAVLPPDDTGLELPAPSAALTPVWPQSSLMFIGEMKTPSE
jgi:hypothetical protein